MKLKSLLVIATFVALVPAVAIAETSVLTTVGRYLGWGFSDGYHAGRCCAPTCSSCQGSPKGAYATPVYAEPVFAPPRQDLPAPMPDPQTMGWMPRPGRRMQRLPVAGPMQIQNIVPTEYALPVEQWPFHPPIAAPPATWQHPPARYNTVSFW